MRKVKGKRLKDKDKSPLLEIEKFEGVCPECGQPFLAEYVNTLEEAVISARETIRSLDIVIKLRDRHIKELESKKLVLVKTKVDVSKN